MNKERILLILILNCVITYLDAANSRAYGLLSVRVQSVEVCRGPKRRDCCVPKVSVTNGTKITYDLLVTENFVLTSGKLLATLEGKEVMKFQMKKPCDHFLIRSLFHVYLNISDNCAVRKGHHIFTADAEEISKTYYGGKFFYGNLTFRAVFSGNDCNFFCNMMHVAMIPKQ